MNIGRSERTRKGFVHAIALVAIAVLCVTPLAASSHPPNSATYHSDPPAAPAVSTTDLVLRKELNAYPNYGAADGRSDIAYSGQAATWVFASEQLTGLGGLPVGLAPLFFRVFLAADDHYGVPIDLYTIAVWTNGVPVPDPSPPLPHGQPFAVPFDNWLAVDYPVQGMEHGVSLTVQNTSPLGAGDWIAIDAVELHVGVPS